MPQHSINYKALTDMADEFVVTEQRVGYEFLRKKLGGIGVGTTSKILRRLETKGLIRRDKGRKWTVIVNRDGTPKPESEIPPKRIFKKARRKVVIPVVIPDSAPAEGFTVTQAMKIELLELLAEAAEGKATLILQAIVSDLEQLSRSRKLLDILKD